MTVEDLRRAYAFNSNMHKGIQEVLDGLDDKKPLYYKKRTKILKVSIVCAVFLLLSLTTIVATGTNLFGMFSNPVGKYGLNISVYDETELDKNNNVKVVLGYIPDGYAQIVAEDGGLIENVYSYNADPYCLKEFFSYYIKSADNYKLEESFVIDSSEYEFDGNKTIIVTRQYEENGKKDYFAVKYFADLDYVVECFSDNQDELIKIIEKLELESVESKEPVEDLESYKEEVTEDANLSYRVSDTLTIVEKGGYFDFTSLIIKGVENVPEFTKKADNFTIRFKDIEETDNCIGLKRECFLHNGYLNNEVYISNFFDSNDNLITPYTRTDRNNGDGINSLDKTWETTDDRHFYLVTLEVTANTEYTDFDTTSIWVSTIDKNSDGEYDFLFKHGDINLVYIQEKNEFNHIEISKGETKEIVVGVVVDDDVLDYGYLTFKATIRKVSDNGNKVNDVDKYYCMKLSNEVDYE